MRYSILLLLTCIYSYSQVSYVPDVKVRKEITKAVWEKLQLQTPKEYEPSLAFLFKSDQMFQLYENTMKVNGFEPYQISTVAGFVEDVCNEVTTGAVISTQQSIKNVREIQAYFKENPIDFDLTNIQKQKKYDELILKTVWAGSLNEMMNKKSGTAREIAILLLNAVNENTIPQPKSSVSNPEIDVSSTSEPKKNSVNISIKEVVMITTTSYGLSGMYISNDVYALFANGESLYEPSEPLENFDVTESKNKNPKYWDTWEIKNNILYLKDGIDGKVSDWENWFKVRPATEGFRINGVFKTSDPFTASNIINSSMVYFDGQGRFEWKTTKGGTGGWRPVLVNTDSSGTYSINNRTITLNYGNGTTQSFFFGLYPKDDVHFIIGSSHFRPVSK